MELMVEQGYKQTEAGTVPHDWNVTQVGQAFVICNNLRLPLSEGVRKGISGDYPYYGPTKVQDYINEYRVEGEYALIGEDGDHFLKWNTLPMTQLATGRFNVNNHAHLLKGNDRITTTQWFYYFFKHRDITNCLTRQGAGRYKLTKAALQALPCAFPPSIEEQTAIATALSEADALIAGLEKLIEKKRLIKQGAMQELLRPKEGWEEVQLKECLDLLTDFEANGSFESVAENVSIHDTENHAWYVRATDLENNSELSLVKYVDKRSYNFLKKTSLAGDEVLITKRGEIGKVYYFKMKTKYATLAPNMYLLKLNKSVHPYYIYCYFKNDVGNRLLIEKNASTTLGALYKDAVKAIPVMLPPTKAEQIEIASTLLEMDNEIQALERKLTKQKEIKQGMMQVLLTGKVRLV